MEQKRKDGVGAYLDLGLQFAIAVALGVGLGYFADDKLGTFPLCLVLGLFLGATSGFLNIYRTVFPKNSNKNKEPKSSDEN